MKLVLAFALFASTLWADKIHIFKQTSPGIFRAVVHVATPPGSNSATPAITWVAVLEAVVSERIEACQSNVAGTGSRCTGSVLRVGSRDNEISQAEEDAIKAGTTTEYVVDNLPLKSCGHDAACVNGRVDKWVTDRRPVDAETYEFYGQVVN